MTTFATVVVSLLVLAALAFLVFAVIYFWRHGIRQSDL
jgi:hypothetical protein